MKVVPGEKIGHVTKPGVADYRQNPGDTEAALHAAAFYAKRDGMNMVCVASRNGDHLIWQILKESADLGRLGIPPGSEVPGYLAQPNCDIFNAQIANNRKPNPLPPAVEPTASPAEGMGRGESPDSLAKRVPKADWTEIEGSLVLRCGDSRFVAVPANGKKTSASFDVIDLEKRDNIVCFLKRDEVRNWLWQRALQEADGVTYFG